MDTSLKPAFDELPSALASPRDSGMAPTAVQAGADERSRTRFIAANDRWDVLGYAAIGGAATFALGVAALGGAILLGRALAGASPGLAPTGTELVGHWLAAVMGLAIAAAATFMVASMASMLVASGWGVVGGLLFEDELPTWYATMVGGWTAFGLLILPAVAINNQSFVWPSLALAVVICQGGSYANIRRARRRGWLHASAPGSALTWPRFRLRQILALTVVIALPTAAIGQLPFGAHLAAGTAGALVAQLLVACCFALCRRLIMRAPRGRSQ